jgi:hypothetical protein
MGLETNRSLPSRKAKRKKYLVKGTSTIMATRCNHGLCPRIVGKMWARSSALIGVSRGARWAQKIGLLLSARAVVGLTALGLGGPGCHRHTATVRRSGRG